eukprot:6920215-Pyramimonas_sp.AAC.2
MSWAIIFVRCISGDSKSCTRSSCTAACRCAQTQSRPSEASAVALAPLPSPAMAPPPPATEWREALRYTGDA